MKQILFRTIAIRKKRSQYGIRLSSEHGMGKWPSIAKKQVWGGGQWMKIAKKEKLGVKEDSG